MEEGDDDDDDDNDEPTIKPSRSFRSASLLEAFWRLLGIISELCWKPFRPS